MGGGAAAQLCVRAQLSLRAPGLHSGLPGWGVEGRGGISPCRQAAQADRMEQREQSIRPNLREVAEQANRAEA